MKLSDNITLNGHLNLPYFLTHLCSNGGKKLLWELRHNFFFLRFQSSFSFRSLSPHKQNRFLMNHNKDLLNYVINVNNNIDCIHQELCRISIEDRNEVFFCWWKLWDFKLPSQVNSSPTENKTIILSLKFNWNCLCALWITEKRAGSAEGQKKSVCSKNRNKFLAFFYLLLRFDFQ